MKTQSLLSALFISSALILTSACTPQDKKVTDGVKTVKQKNLDDGAGGEFTLSNFPIVSFIGERHVEAIELVKLATGSLDSKRTQYSIELTARDNAQAVKVIKSLQDPFEYRSNASRWKVGGEKTYEATVEKDTVVRSAEIKGVKVRTTVDSKLKKRNFVNLSEKSYSIKVSPEGTDNLKIEMVTAGELYGAKGGDGASKEINLVVKMIVNAASLETDEVQVLSVDSMMLYPNINPKNPKKFEMPFQGKNLIVKIDALCNALIGSAEASAGPKFKFTANFNSTEITIEKNDWFSELGDCGKRPTVDLSRYLVL